jgi:hypothetical protein
MKDLWSSDKTFDDILDISELDSDTVITNLHEDVLCLQERVKELEKLNLSFATQENERQSKKINVSK